MNLQVNSPYTKCPYRCPYCVAGVSSTYPFADTLYNQYPAEYLRKLVAVVKKHNITTVVLTGSTEPTLFPAWLWYVCTTLRPLGIKVELQTKNYHWRSTYDTIGVIAYSHDKIPTHKRLPIKDCLVRDVFLWNKALTARSIVNYFKSQPNVDQLTIKQLVASSYGIKSIDDHIAKITKPMTIVDKIIFQLNGAWVDKDCADSEGRYLIYRTDGHIYQKWSDTLPIG